MTNGRPTLAISESDIRTYEEDGVVCLLGLFGRSWIDRMYAATDRVIASGKGQVREGTKPGEPGRFYANIFMAQWDAEFRDFALRAPGAEIAARLLRQPSVNFFYDQLFVKEPNTPAPTYWHHDLPYWPFRGNDIVSIWVALTDVSVETSGLEYVAGSHRWGKWFRAITPDQDPARMDMTAEVCPDFSDPRQRGADKRILSWDMAAGDCICHHPLTVHGSGGNRSQTQRRLALSVRYMGADAIWDPRPLAVKLPGDPQLPAGKRPADEAMFPRAWPAAEA
ncbi:MAG: phytanoyl-CoA dioxygenase family protein [Planctomycetia bacterium]|nr:phytanoyl-CoA dioxygenase family protein [Planctomycetia bacterium]